MMTSSNGNTFCVTGPLWGESTGHRWQYIGHSPHKSQWRGALMFSSICAWTSGWANNQGAGDLRCHHPHYDVTVTQNAFIYIVSSLLSILACPSVVPTYCKTNAHLFFVRICRTLWSTFRCHPRIQQHRVTFKTRYCGCWWSTVSTPEHQQLQYWLTHNFPSKNFQLKG